ncbi:lipopolysaccharide biosynthesis protein [Xanthovirga aplysinae]|uniref:lipopolysaccharide biosynthesis protein n=1 Tax=Xanthovirga aplysinae TaxID=2529853 RepID=UPI0012BC321B|nr:polysaccharide biosynthesis C-terminal domain-containing protein [Xanthovirga aplysinae]MTI30213.1 polysaccharide biosynthesis protein [Xanthovirga aplysinae]
MNPLKKLAGQTAIYGVSSIVGRFLTYLLTPFLTKIFISGEYGIVSQIYAYVAILNVVYTFGMETAYFRFSYKLKDERVYHQTLTAILVVGGCLSALIYFNSAFLATLLDIPDKSHIIRWVALILFMDGVVAIPFARLRYEGRAKKFATLKLIAIFLQTSLTIFLLYIPKILNSGIPIWLQSLIEVFQVEGWGVEYVFVANLVSSLFTFLLLSQYLLKLRPQVSWVYFKPMLLYGFPILLTGLTGMLNDQFATAFFPYLLPEGFYPGKSTLSALGIYSATLKLSIFMALAVQAFRYAGEPFFFSQAEEKNAPELFSRIMHYFVIFCVIILVGVTLNVNIIADVFLKRKVYHEALYLVPILLFGRLFFGMYVNFSVWFKLTDKTYFGTIISSIGTIITLLGNFLLIPVLGYTGSALASLFCFFFMAIICYQTGKKRFPVPYDLKSIGFYLLSALGMIAVSQFIRIENMWVDNLLRVVFTLSYILIIFLIEKRKLAVQSL